MMRHIFYLSFLMVALSISFTIQAQEEIIRGIVADSATFNPLPSVTIRIKHTTKGTTTDLQGNFSILATQKDTLIISLVGYETIEQPLYGWEPSMILLPEKVTLLKTIIIQDTRIENPYEGMFDDQNAQLRKQNKSIPFYYSKARKDKIKLGRLQNENIRVKTYVDVVVKNPELKERLMKEYNLTETQYYNLLADFNAKNYSVMYYLTAGELISLINNFFSRHARLK
jgi:hypothetical protein